jgi:serine/threonine-protein kinase
MRSLDQSEPVVFARTEGAYEPFFSPDGRWIGFFNGHSLQKISVDGGAPVTLCPAEDVQRGASWGKDGFIIANLDNSHLFRIPESGGKPEMLRGRPEDHGEQTWRWPQILPDGRSVLFTGSRGSGAGGGFDEARIEVLSLDTGKVTVVHRGGYFGRYLPTGHLVYIHQGTLFAAPMDLTRLQIRGVPLPILDDAAGDSSLGTGMLDFSRSLDRPGILAYRSGKASEVARTLAWIDSAGGTEPMLTGVAPGTPAISPDGKSVALSMAGNILVHDLDRGVSTSLTRNSLINNSPVWTRDGRHLVFDQDGGDETTIWWTRADGSGEPSKLFASTDGLRVRSISPDSRRIAFARQNARTGWDIWMLPLDVTDPDRPRAGQPELFLGEPYDQFAPAFSPDGQWVAYSGSAADFLTEIYVRPFTGGASGRKWQVSTGGGLFPVWSRDGRELFFSEPHQGIMRVKYTVNGGDFAAGKPERWPSPPIVLTRSLYWNFDVTPDGRRLLTFPAPLQAQERPSFHITVLLNFFDELRRKAP